MKKTLSLGVVVIIGSLLLASMVFAEHSARSSMPASGAKVFNPGFSGRDSGPRPVPQSRNPQPQEQSGNFSFGRPSSPAKIYNPAERPGSSPQFGDNSVWKKPVVPSESNNNRPYDRPSSPRLIEKPSSAKIYKPGDRPNSDWITPSPKKPIEIPSSAKIYKPGNRPASKPVDRPSIIKPIERPSSAKIYKPVERPSVPRIERPSSKPIVQPSSDSSRKIVKPFSPQVVERRSFTPTERRPNSPQTHIPIPRESRDNRESWRHDRYDRSHDRDSYPRHRSSYHNRYSHHDWTDYWGLGFRYSWDDFSIYVNAGWDWRWDLDFYYYHSDPYWYWDAYYYGDDFGISFTSGHPYYRPYRVWVSGYWSPVYDWVSYYDPYGEIGWRQVTRWNWVPGYWDYRAW